jgi:DNA primase
MSHTIDFAELKERVSIEQAADMLGIKLKKTGLQLRDQCPICTDNSDRAFVITPAKGLYYCFGKCGKGGDAITMAANVCKCSLREAAEFLVGKSGGSAASATGTGSRHDSPQPMTPLEHFIFANY